MSDTDSYLIHLEEEKGFDALKVDACIRLLKDELGLIKVVNNFLQLTIEGNSAFSLGIKKYLDQIEESAQLDKDVAQSSIKSAKDSSRRSKQSIIISLTTLIAAIFFNAIILFKKDNTSQIIGSQKEEIQQLRNSIKTLEERQAVYDSLLESKATKDIESNLDTSKIK